MFFFCLKFRVGDISACFSFYITFKGQSNGLKYFHFGAFAELFIFLVKKLTPEIDSPWYDTPGSYVLMDFILTRRGIIPQGVLF